MSAADIITIIVALGGLATIVGGVIVNILAAAKTNAKLETISGHVNSAATAAAAKIEALQGELVAMRREMAEKKQIAALVAQATATAQPPVEP